MLIDLLPAAALRLPGIAQAWKATWSGTLPPEHDNGVGDYFAIGEEFTRYFHELAGLHPDAAVLDVGCGSGRIALGLTRCLSRDGRYSGFDIRPEAIRWCAKHITPRFPNFRFQVVDIVNDAYAPGGRIRAEEFRFPYPDASFDFAVLTSVFTHMQPADVRRYLAELARVLKPGGTSLITWFALNQETRRLTAEHRASLGFHWQHGESWAADPRAIEIATGYEESWIRQAYAAAGFDLVGDLHPGSWPGRTGRTHYQDIVVARRRPPPSIPPAAPQGPAISFIIPLYNGLAHTRECLRTLQATLPAGLTHEILFVDDGSTDGTHEWLATLGAPCRTLLNERNLGFAGACNRGAATATGELLFFLNNDLVLLPGWLEPMRGLLRRRKNAALVGNVQLRTATGALDHAGVHFDAKGKPGHDVTRPLLSRLLGWREVPAVTGACFGLRRSTWEALGGFDEGFRNGGEDIDLCLRARAAGLRTLVSLRSVVLHHVSASPGRKRRDEENSRRLALRWRGEIARLSARAWSWQYLAAVWDRTGNQPDLRLGMEAFGVTTGLIAPTARTIAGTDAALEIEFARWAQLLDGAPASATAEPARGRADQL